MCGDKHSGLFVIICQNGAQDIVPGGRVHTSDRLVEHIELGVPAHNENKLHFLFRPLRKGTEPGVPVNLQRVQHTLRPFQAEVPVKIRIKGQSVFYAHLFSQAVLVRKI